MIEIRPATDEEVYRVLEMIEMCVTEVMSEDDARNEIHSRISEPYVRLMMRRNPWNVTVMDLDGYLIGFMLSSNSSSSNTAVLEWMYVLPHFRKTPAALKACRTYIDSMREAGIRQLMAFTTESNRPVLALCRRFGIKVERNVKEVPKLGLENDGLMLTYSLT